MTIYLLDSNVFIQAKNFHYGFDICPGFWDWLDQAVPDGAAHSITKVYDELAGGGDDLATWIKQRKDDGRFLDVTDVVTQTEFRKVVQVVDTRPYQEAAKAAFLSGADPWLVAKAKVVDATVVTHEKPAPEAKRRVPLPDICTALGVKWIDPFELLRARSAAFGLIDS